MFIKITYICDGAIYCGFRPEDANVLEERQVLYAEEGYELLRLSDRENMGNSVWLKDGDIQENYIEIEAQEDIF